MIASLRGDVLAIDGRRAVIEVGGVGYEVSGSAQLFATLSVGAPAQLRVHTAVSDRGIRLWAVADDVHLALFRRLIAIPRIGPQTACDLLAGLGPDGLAAACASGDAATVARVPGIGARSAASILAGLAGDPPVVAAPGLPGSPAATAAQTLEAMGFAAAQAREAVGMVVAQGECSNADAAGLLTAALRRLAPERENGPAVAGGPVR